MIGYRKTSIVAIYLYFSWIAMLSGLVNGEDWLTHTAVILSAFMGANIFDGSKK